VTLPSQYPYFTERGTTLISGKIIHLEEGAVKYELKELVRNNVETFNELLE
jgi:hypothetical protein